MKDSTSSAEDVMQPCETCGGKHHRSAQGNSGRAKCAKIAKEYKAAINAAKAVNAFASEPFYLRVYYGLWYIVAPRSYFDDWIRRANAKLK